MMKEQAVLFKGTRGGLKIYIDDKADLSRIKYELLRKIDSNRHFFEGIKVNLTFEGKSLSFEEKKEIVDFISNEVEIGSVKFEDGEAKQNLNTEEFKDTFDGIEEGMTRFIRGTVRNGQRIFYEGNVVVLGDVNPGGEVIAGGNIIVLGALRGLAHAGVTGNGRAIVASFSLQPTQLRIGNVITRPPDGENIKPSYPEIAYIKEGNLVIEPYLPGKIK